MEKKKIMTKNSWINIIIAILLFIGGVGFIIAENLWSYPTCMGFCGIFGIACFILGIVFILAAIIGLNLEISQKIKVHGVVGWLFVVLGVIVLFFFRNIYSLFNLPLIFGLILLWRANKMKKQLNLPK